MGKLTLRVHEDFLICNACGLQYPEARPSAKNDCMICDDPRQFVPPEGQSFTTLRELREAGHKNIWWQDKNHPEVWSVRTEPKFAIGERAELIQTPAGNILWDLFTYLDQETVDRIESMGGLKCIVVSHPHYYSTIADWSRTFECPVYIGGGDKEWLAHTDGADIRFIDQEFTNVLDGAGATAILTGGHFPGSLLLHWKDLLFVADTIIMSPSAVNPVPGKPGVISFTFMWSIPNRIPLPPDDISRICRLVKKFDFVTCFGAFEGHDVYTMDNEAARGTGGVKGRILESGKIQVKAMGWTDHAILKEI